jgi:hypothetical protein
LGVFIIQQFRRFFCFVFCFSEGEKLISRCPQRVHKQILQMAKPLKTQHSKWRLGPLLLLAAITVMFLAPPMVSTLSAEPRAKRITIVNGARPEFLQGTLLIATTDSDSEDRSSSMKRDASDIVVFVFADKREYDVAATLLGGAHFPVGRSDMMVAWLGCRPLQILQAFGIKRTGEIIETSASLSSSSVDDSHFCHEDDAIPSSTAALLASNSGEFLLAAAGKLLRWGADEEGLFAHDAKVVVLQPSDAVLCSGHSHAARALFSKLDSCNKRDCVKLVSLGKGNTSFAVGALRYFVDSGAAMLRWWQRAHPPPRRRQHYRMNSNGTGGAALDLSAFTKGGYGSQLDLTDVELFSPFFFIGTLHGIAKFSELVQDVLVESPIAPGYAHEVVIASAVRNMRDHQWLRKSNKWLNLKPFTVTTLSPLEFPVGTQATCLKERACRGAVRKPPAAADAVADTNPIAFIRPHVCGKQQPLQAPRISVPCRSGMYDDFYLLHKAIVDPQNSSSKAASRTLRAGEAPRAVAQPMEVLPLEIVQSEALARRWVEFGKDAVEAAAREKRASALLSSQNQIRNLPGPSGSPPGEQHDAEASECPGRALNAVLGMCGSYEPSVVSAFVRTFVKFHKRGCTRLLLFVDEELLAAYQSAYGSEEDVELVSTLPFSASLKLKDCGTVVYRTELLAAWLDSEHEHYNSPLNDAPAGPAAGGAVVDAAPQATAAAGGGTTTQSSQPPPPPFRYVMVVDTRDSFFQTDPFEPVADVVRGSSSVPPDSPTTHSPPSAVYLIAERFDQSSIDLYNPIVYEFNERLAGGSCGQPAVHWSFRLQLAPIPPPPPPPGKSSKRRRQAPAAAGASSTSKGAWAPVEPLPVVCLGMLFGTYHAMRDLLHLLAQSMIARIEGEPQMCGVPIDQGMLNCLVYGGLAHAKYAHDVVLLNPYTQPYTHSFRSNEEIVFGAAAKTSENYKFIQTCPRVPRRFARGPGQSSSLQKRRARPFAVVHQADRHSELYFYATEVLTQDNDVQAVEKK